MGKGRRNSKRRRMHKKYIKDPKREMTQKYEAHQGYNWKVLVPKGKEPDVLDLMINPDRKIRY